MKKSIVDESVLDGIPDELIRPLLAISIRASRPHTIENYKQLLKELRRLGKLCHGEFGVYYNRVEGKLNREMWAMIDSQKWAQKTDPEAQTTSIDVNQWLVNIRSHDRDRRLLIKYCTRDADINGLRIHAVVTDADEKDV